MATYSHSRISTYENCPVGIIKYFRLSLSKRKDVEEE